MSWLSEHAVHVVLLILYLLVLVRHAVVASRHHRNLDGDPAHAEGLADGRQTRRRLGQP